MKLNVWNSGAALLIAMTVTVACNKPDQPFLPEVEVPDGDWQSVGTGAGTIEMDGVSIEYPAGTFSSGDRVAVTPVSSGKVGGDSEASSFYQVVLPSGGTKQAMSFVVSCDGANEGMQMVAQNAGWNRHTGNLSPIISPLMAQYSTDEGYFKTTIPPIEANPDQSPFFTIGVLNGVPVEDTKASSSYAVTWAMSTFPLGKWMIYSKKFSVINAYLDEYIPEAHAKLKELGFQFPSNTIVYKVEYFTENKEDWGFFDSSCITKSWGYVRLNVERLYELATASDPTALQKCQNDIRQTLVHETFHAVGDMVYDPRSAYTIANEGSKGDEWAMLSEAVGCWSEKVTGTRLVSENTPHFVDGFLQGFFPASKDQLLYRNNGYGMGFLIDHISNHVGNDKIVNLYKAQKNGEVKTIIDGLNLLVKDSDISNILNDEYDYADFLRNILTGKQDSRTDMASLDSAPVREEFNGSENKRFQTTVRPFGCAVQTITLPKDKIKGMADKVLRIRQEGSQVVSYVYLRREQGQFELLGAITEGLFADVPMSSFKAGVNGYVYVASFRRPEQIGGKEEDVPSELFVTLVEQELPTVTGIELDFDFEDNFIRYPITWYILDGKKISVAKEGNGIRIKSRDDSDGGNSISILLDSFVPNKTGTQEMGSISNVVFDFKSEKYNETMHWEIDSSVSPRPLGDLYIPFWSYWRYDAGQFKLENVSATSNGNPITLFVGNHSYVEVIIQYNYGN